MRYILPSNMIINGEKADTWRVCVYVCIFWKIACLSDTSILNYKNYQISKCFENTLTTLVRIDTLVCLSFPFKVEILNKYEKK